MELITGFNKCYLELDLASKKQFILFCKMTHIKYLNFNSAFWGQGGKSILHESVPFEGIKINEQKFGSKQGVQLFQYRRC